MVMVIDECSVSHDAARFMKIAMGPASRQHRQSTDTIWSSAYFRYTKE